MLLLILSSCKLGNDQWPLLAYTPKGLHAPRYKVQFQGCPYLSFKTFVLMGEACLFQVIQKMVLFAAANETLSSAMSIIRLLKDGYNLLQQRNLFLWRLPLLILQNICFNGWGLPFYLKMVTICCRKGISFFGIAYLFRQRWMTRNHQTHNFDKIILF